MEKEDNSDDGARMESVIVGGIVPAEATGWMCRVACKVAIRRLVGSGN